MERKADIQELMIEGYKDQIAVGGELIQKQYDTIQDYQAKLAESERRRERLKRWLIVAGVAVLIETVVIVV